MAPVDDAAVQAQIDPEKVLTFPQGIPGFETYTRFRLFHKEENNVSAYWLESFDLPTVTFTLVDPTAYGLNYELHLDESEVKILGTSDPRDLAVLMMLSKKEQGEDRPDTLNANIIGPIVINPKTRIGLQKVIVRSQLNVSIIEA
jgi:flagellar assembly factor FliW